jgi:hypothetical protein
MKTFKQFCEDAMATSALPANNTESVPIPKEPIVSKKNQKDYTKKQFSINLNTGRKLKSTF